MYTATVQTHRIGILLASTILTVPHLVARTTESSAAAPAPRYAHQMMTYDDHGGRVLLFGGAGQDATFGDFWSLDAHGWTRLSESGGPPARNSGVLVFDSRRKRAVLFGGRGGDQPLRDTWEWDGARWTSVATGGPAPGIHTVAAFDRQRGVVVLFVPLLAAGKLVRPLQTETWLWDGRTWTKAAGTSPEDCLANGMTVDEASGAVMLLTGRFGPSEYGVPLAGSDLWTWTGAGWHHVSDAPAVSEPFLSTIAPAGKSGGVLLFDGSAGKSAGVTWRWDGRTWSEVSRSGPSARNVHVMAYDRARDRVVLFGGSVGQRRLGDTWEWDDHAWSERR